MRTPSSNLAAAKSSLRWPALKTSSPTLEARHRRRGGRVLGLVRGVVGREGRDRGLDVEEVAENEKLAGPGVAEGLDHGRLAGGLDLFVVGHELGPGHRHRQSELFIDLLVVEDAATHRRLFRHAVDAAIRRRNDRLERVDDVGLERLVGQIEHGLRRVQRLEERAGVVAEDVRHLARRKPRLHEVVALAAARMGLDLDLYVGVLGFEGGLEALGRRHVGRIVVDIVGERHLGAGDRRRGEAQRKGCRGA